MADAQPTSATQPAQTDASSESLLTHLGQPLDQPASPSESNGGAPSWPHASPRRDHISSPSSTVSWPEVAGSGDELAKSLLLLKGGDRLAAAQLLRSALAHLEAPSPGPVTDDATGATMPTGLAAGSLASVSLSPTLNTEDDDDASSECSHPSVRSASAAPAPPPAPPAPPAETAVAAARPTPEAADGRRTPANATAATAAPAVAASLAHPAPAPPTATTASGKRSRTEAGERVDDPRGDGRGSLGEGVPSAGRAPRLPRVGMSATTDEADELRYTLVWLLSPAAAEVVVGSCSEVGLRTGCTLALQTPTDSRSTPVTELRLRVSGKLSAVPAAHQAVAQLLSAATLRPGGLGSGAGSGTGGASHAAAAAAPAEASASLAEETRVLVNNAAVRHVIGKAGSMIHKLEQEAGAWISIQSEREMAAEGRRARKVTIKGSPEARSRALYLISRVLAVDPAALDIDHQPLGGMPTQQQPQQPLTAHPLPGLPRQQQQPQQQPFAGGFGEMPGGGGAEAFAAAGAGASVGVAGVGDGGWGRFSPPVGCRASPPTSAGASLRTSPSRGAFPFGPPADSTFSFGARPAHAASGVGGVGVGGGGAVTFAPQQGGAASSGGGGGGGGRGGDGLFDLFSSGLGLTSDPQPQPSHTQPQQLQPQPPPQPPHAQPPQQTGCRRSAPRDAMSLSLGELHDELGTSPKAQRGGSSSDALAQRCKAPRGGLSTTPGRPLGGASRDGGGGGGGGGGGRLGGATASGGQYGTRADDDRDDDVVPGWAGRTEVSLGQVSLPFAGLGLAGHGGSSLCNGLGLDTVAGATAGMAISTPVPAAAAAAAAVGPAAAAAVPAVHAAAPSAAPSAAPAAAPGAPILGLPPANPSTTCVSITVPNWAVAGLIGKRGAKIAEIERTSGARISIAPEDGKPERTVTLSGAPERRLAAYTSICTQLSSWPANEPRQSPHR